MTENLNRAIAETHAYSVANNLHNPSSSNWQVVFDHVYAQKLAELEPVKPPVMYTEEEVKEILIKWEEARQYSKGQFSGTTSVKKWFEANKKK